MSNGRLVGWGGKRGRHTNVGDGAVCKKQLLLAGEPSDACRARIKMWLLSGLDEAQVSSTSDIARFEHLGVNPRTSALVPEDELDRDLVVLLAS